MVQNIQTQKVFWMRFHHGFRSFPAQKRIDTDIRAGRRLKISGIRGVHCFTRWRGGQITVTRLRKMSWQYKNFYFRTSGLYLSGNVCYTVVCSLVQSCVIRCSENAAKCNAISVLCIWISDKKESDKMKTIDDDIRSGNFKQIYLLYGTEAYLKSSIRQIENAMAAPDDNMNFTTLRERISIRKK